MCTAIAEGDDVNRCTVSVAGEQDSHSRLIACLDEAPSTEER